MKICCVACQIAFLLRTAQLSSGGSMVRCPMCGYIFVVYAPDIFESPITQDTNIDQSILDDLLEMQKKSGGRPAPHEDPTAGGSETVDNLNSLESAAGRDSVINNSHYADLPDLSELEKTIEWDEINDAEDPPGRFNRE